MPRLEKAVPQTGFCVINFNYVEHISTLCRFFLVLPLFFQLATDIHLKLNAGHRMFQEPHPGGQSTAPSLAEVISTVS